MMILMTTDSMMAAAATEPSAAPYNAQLDPQGAFLLGPSTDEPCPGPGPKPKNPKTQDQDALPNFLATACRSGCGWISERYQWYSAPLPEQLRFNKPDPDAFAML